MWVNTAAVASLAVLLQPALAMPQNNVFFNDKADVLQDNLRLKAALTTWLGEGLFNHTNRGMQLDLMKAGYEHRTHALATIESAMQFVVNRHTSGEPCSSLPKAVAASAWRLNPTELEACLTSGPWASSSCSVRCALLPEVSVSLSCAGAGPELSGEAPEGECRFARSAESTVETTGGTLRGMVRPVPWVWEDGRETVERTRAFWSVPYAAPAERFRPPQPISQRWPGVWDAPDSYDTSAPVRTHCAGMAPFEDGTGVEGCLFLDIYTPFTSPGAAGPLPVMVFLFGGGFMGGDAWRDGHYDGARFTVRNGVLLVVLAHRVGFLGHWAHPALQEESGDGTVGNYEELDQRMALKWIQQNIRNFGGDPSRVTLVGHSSGAFDLTFHLLSPGSKGLFSGMILESATYDNDWYFQEKESAFVFYEELGEALGCPKDVVPEGGWRQGMRSEQIACIRQLPWKDILQFTKGQVSELTHRATGSKASLAWSAVQAILAGFGINRPVKQLGLLENDTLIHAVPMWPLLPVGIVVDGSEQGLPASPRKLWEAAKANDVQVWINHEADEGTIFASMLLLSYPWFKKPELTHSAVDTILDWAFGANASQAAVLKKMYPRSKDMSWPFTRLSSAIGDGIFVCSARRAAQVLSTRRANSTFYGKLTYKGSAVPDQRAFGAVVHRDLGFFLGAHHCEQPRWIFGSIGDYSHWNSVDQRMQQLLNCHYARMAHCGDPGAQRDSECLARLNASGQVLHACAALGGFPKMPAYDPKVGARLLLDPAPELNRPEVPAELENERCAFWDGLAAVGLRPNNCRNCRRPRARQAEQTSIVV